MKIKLLIGLILLTINLFSQVQNNKDSANKALVSGKSTGQSMSPKDTAKTQKDVSKTQKGNATNQIALSLIGGRWIWKAEIIMQKCNMQGTPITSGNQPYVISQIGQKFSVIGFNKDSSMAMIKIVNYRSSFLLKKTTKKSRKNNSTYFTKESGKDTNLLVSPKMVEQFATKDTTKILKTSVAIGVINFPFKYRPQLHRGDFSGTFNFGAAAGLTFRHNTSRSATFTLLTGYSISNLNLDSVSVTSNSKKLVSTNNYTAFSFSCGFMVQYSKAQVGFFIGWDQLTRINDAEFGWKYQGRPWLSVGIGFAIFSIQSNTETPTTQSNP